MNLMARMAPTQDFSNSLKSGRETIAVYVAKTADGDTLTLHSPINDEDVTFITGGQFLPTMTDEVVAGADAAAYTKVYFYDEAL